MRKMRSAQQGSFLIEAMLAVVILSCALVILIRSFTMAIAAVHAQQGYVQAIVLLQEELDTVISKGLIDRTTNRIVQKSVADNVFEIRVAAKPVAGRHINEVHLSVVWPAASRQQRTITAVTYLLDLTTKASEYAQQ